MKELFGGGAVVVVVVGGGADVGGDLGVADPGNGVPNSLLEWQ